MCNRFHMYCRFSTRNRLILKFIKDQYEEQVKELQKQGKQEQEKSLEESRIMSKNISQINDENVRQSITCIKFVSIVSIRTTYVINVLNLITPSTHYGSSSILLKMIR
jgi:hypothetical protein